MGVPNEVLVKAETLLIDAVGEALSGIVGSLGDGQITQEEWHTILENVVAKVKSEALPVLLGK